MSDSKLKRAQTRSGTASFTSLNNLSKLPIHSHGRVAPLPLPSSSDDKYGSEPCFAAVAPKLPKDVRFIPLSAPRNIFMLGPKSAALSDLPCTASHLALNGPSLLTAHPNKSAAKRELQSKAYHGVLARPSAIVHPPMQAFSEVVSHDVQEAVDEYLIHELLDEFIRSSLFRNTILACIILVSMLVGLATDPSMQTTLSQTALGIINFIILTIFTLEILLKWMQGFAEFWRVPWNVFDFLLVSVSLVSELLGSQLSFLSSGRILRIFRVLRALRTLRGISNLRSLQMIVETILDSMPDMMNILLLLFIVAFIFAIVGVDVFGQAVPNFSTVGDTFYTLFIIATQDGWETIFWNLADAGYFWAAAIYFVGFVVIGPFMFVNVLAGVVFIQLQVSTTHMNREMKRQNRLIQAHPSDGHREDGDGGQSDKSDNHHSDNKSDVQGQQSGTGGTGAGGSGVFDVSQDVAGVEIVPESTWSRQKAARIPDFSKLSPALLENYFLLLMAIEDNLAEFKKFKSSLHNIEEDVKMMNLDDDPEAIRDNVSDDYGDEDELDVVESSDVISRLISIDAAKERNIKKHQEMLQLQMVERRMHVTGNFPSGAHDDVWPDGDDKVEVVWPESSDPMLSSILPSNPPPSPLSPAPIARPRPLPRHQPQADESQKTRTMSATLIRHVSLPSMSETSSSRFASSLDEATDGQNDQAKSGTDAAASPTERPGLVRHMSKSALKTAASTSEGLQHRKSVRIDLSRVSKLGRPSSGDLRAFLVQQQLSRSRSIKGRSSTVGSASHQDELQGFLQKLSMPTMPETRQSKSSPRD
mmetsp:Transcript_26663/g.43594  ORF Transcript_26663/g.43594 Transcript_26663/m.43594 type:complete len:813 (+) Transcript_26663:354-2792(+)